MSLPEAAAACARDLDGLLEAGAEQRLKCYVIARAWALTTGGRVSGYVGLPPETVLLARNHDHVLVGEGTVDGRPVQFKAKHEVLLGGLFVPAEAIEKLANSDRVPGPKAEWNSERTVGALALYVAELAPALRKPNGEPNADAIAEAVYDLLNRNGLMDSGLSARAIQDRILQALRKLKT